MSCQEGFVEKLCKSLGLPVPEREYRFHPKRRWRFDYAWPDKKIAVEVEGGTWIYGRHNHPSGFLKDIEKYNSAVILGWRILRYTPQQIAQGEWIEDLKSLGL